MSSGPRSLRGLIFSMANTSLQQFIQDLSGEDHSRVQDDLGNGFVRLRAAEAQRRQAKQDIRSFEDVVIEMLRNARDANAKAIFVATWSTKEQRFLTMLDDGDGVPLQLQDTIFEPFVTSKLDSFHADRWGVHGRGMALYSIRQNTDSSRVVASAPGMGSVFSVASSFSRLSEKRDQSSAPKVTLNENGKPVLRGPHNIMRTVLEFAIDERDSVAVYLGTPAEIVSTLYWLGSSAASNSAEEHNREIGDLPYIQRFGLCADASALAKLANDFSLPMSDRTAYRILKYEIKPLELHLQLMLAEQGSSSSAKEKPERRRVSDKAIHISREDLDAFCKQVMADYAQLSQSYYLDANVEATIRCFGGELVMRIPLKRDE